MYQADEPPWRLDANCFEMGKERDLRFPDFVIRSSMNNSSAVFLILADFGY